MDKIEHKVWDDRNEEARDADQTQTGLRLLAQVAVLHSSDAHNDAAPAPRPILITCGRTQSLIGARIIAWRVGF